MTPEKIRERIFALHLEKRKKERPRLYLGASEIGKECERALWYSFRAALDSNFAGRMLRLFETGHREEDRMIKELRAAGYDVISEDPRTGRQFEVKAYGGHFSGHFDGLIRLDGEWHLLEIKTANGKRWREVAKHGVEAKKPQHYAQMQVYMGFAQGYWSQWGIKGEAPRKALYQMACKDNDDLYFEVIEYDESAFGAFGALAKDVITATAAPPRIRENPDFYLCRFCDFQELCHFGTPGARVDCRTCCESTPDIDRGGWRCERKQLTTTDNATLRRACSEHVYLSDLLLKCGEVADWGPKAIDAESIDWIEYADGTRNGQGGESSEEIRARLAETLPGIG